MSEKYKCFVDKIANKLVADHTIDAAEIEAYKFGIEVTILKIIHYVSYIAIALCMRKFLEAVVIFAVLYTFRRNTGGFHAKTRLGCYAFSCAVIFLSLLSTHLSIDWRVLTAVSILDLVVLLILSPVQHSNRRMDVDDIGYFRRRLMYVSTLYAVLYIVTTGLGAEYCIALYTIGLTFNILLTIMGKLQTIKQS